MHVFNPATKLGVQKSGYILDRFMGLARQTEIELPLYEPWMAKRYVGLILNSSKNVWNRKSPLNIKEKRQFIVMTVEEANVLYSISQLQYTRFSKIEKFMLWAIKYNNIFVLSLYGICYNTVRDLRNRIRKK